MKINLHCHSNYSDGYASLSEMAEEHQKQGFSAFVVTDHCYPSFIKKGSKSAKKLRDGIVHAMNEDDLKEMMARSEELFSAMNNYLSIMENS